MTPSAKLPPGHSWVETSDGSRTLFSEKFQETCHSTNGAKSETVFHYVKGCKIEEKLSRGKLTILEVGFGLGIGFLTTLEILSSQNKFWSFVSLEIDEDLIEWFRREHEDHPFLKDLKWRDFGTYKTLSCEGSLCSLTILVGNARNSLPEFIIQNQITWNAIYQDAFSPKKNPILWTKEWFEFLRLHSDPDTDLATYSSSTSIRRGLIEAGWKVSPGEQFGPKLSSTRAGLQGETHPEILLRLERSPLESLRDSDM